MNRETLEVLIRLRDQFSAVADRIKGRVDGLNRAFEESVRYSNRMALAFQAAGGVIAGASIKAYAELEQLRIGFTTLLGSAERADEFLRDLYDFAARTPFEIDGLMKQTQLLLALGFEAEQTIPILNAVGDAVAALGGNSALMDRVVLALGQIRSKGKVTAEEMRQLAEAGIPAWEMLADAIGVSIPEAMKLAERGAIDATTGLNAIINGMNERFSGMMHKQSRTILGIWSNLKDNLTLILQQIGERIVDAFHVREAMLRLEEWMGRFKGMLTDGSIDAELQKIERSAKLATAALAGMLAPGLISQAISLGRALMSASRALGPWALLGIAVYKAFEKIGIGMEDVMPVLRRFGSALAGLYNITVGVIDILTSLGGAVIQTFIGNLQAAVDKLRLHWQAVNALFDTSKTWSERWQAYLEYERQAGEIRSQTLVESVRQYEEDLREAGARVQEGFQYIVDAVTGGENAATRAVEDFAGDAGDLKDELDKLVNSALNLGDGLNNDLNPTLGGTGDQAEEVVSWFDKLNSRLDRSILLIRQWSGSVGQLGATEDIGEGEADQPRSSYPTVAPRDGAPVAGGAPLSRLYLTPEEEQRLQQMRQLYDTLSEAGSTHLYITQEQADEWRAWLELLGDLEGAVAGYAAELDDATYAAADNRRRVEELAEQYKSLRLSMDAAGRRTLYITNNEYKAHEEALADLAQYVEGYAAELDEATYRLAEQRQAEDEAAEATENLARQIANLNEELSKLAYSVATDVIGSLEDLLDSGDWGAFVEDLRDTFNSAAATVIDSIVPGLGSLLKALTDLFIAALEKAAEWLDGFTRAGQERLRAAAEAEQAELARGFKFVTAEAFSTIEEQTSQFLLWTRRSFQVVVDETALSIAQTLDQAVSGALQTGIRAFLSGADDWREQFSEAIREAILQGVMEAIIQQAMLEGMLAPWLDKLTRDLAEGNMDAAREDMDALMREADEFADWLEENMGEFRDWFGSSSSSGATDTTDTTLSTPTLSWSLPSVQVMSVRPPWVDEFGDHVADFGVAVGDFRRAVGEMRTAWGVTGA